MTSPLITIGITCFNAVETIERAIASAFAQEWTFTQIIIIDDCSTDGTKDLLKQLNQKHPQLEIINKNQNQGVAAARNTIIDQAKGDYIAFFDDDDESLPNRLAIQYQRLEAHDDHAPAICYTPRTQIYPDGRSHYEQSLGAEEGASPVFGEGVAERILFGKHSKLIFGSGATCSQMAKTSLYRDLQGFDETFRRSEDTDFNVRAALIGTHFLSTQGPLVTQTMTLASDKKLEDEKLFALQLLKKHQNFIEKKTSYSFCVNWLRNKYNFLHGKKLKFVFITLKLFITHPILTSQRFIWAVPNIGFNLKLKKLHRDR